MRVLAEFKKLTSSTGDYGESTGTLQTLFTEYVLQSVGEVFSDSNDYGRLDTTNLWIYLPKLIDIDGEIFVTIDSQDYEVMRIVIDRRKTAFMLQQISR